MGNDSSKELPTKDTNVQLQKKLTKGQSHTLNLYIMGDKGTGKSSLFNMLQRKRYNDSYTHTPQNHSTTISWEFRLSDVEVSVKFWEIIHTRIKTSSSNELKTQNSDSSLSQKKSIVTPDIHAIIFMIDPRKSYTFEYVQREIQHIEHSPDILLVSNFKDQCIDNKNIQVTSKHIQQFILQRNDMKIKHCEASMSDRFGVKAIKTFISIPFTKLEEQFLIKQLERVRNDIETSYQDFDSVSEEQDYSFYKDWLAKAIEQKMQQPNTQRRNQPTLGKNVSPLPRGKTPSPKQKIGNKQSSNSTKNTGNHKSKIKTGMSALPPPSNRPPALGNKSEQQNSSGGGFFGKLKSIVSSEQPTSSQQSNIIKKTDPRKAIHDLKAVAAASRSGKEENISIDAFDPSAFESGDFDNFFSDDEDDNNSVDNIAVFEESEEEDLNPLVESEEDFNYDKTTYTKPIIDKQITPPSKKKKQKSSKIDDSFFSDDDKPNPIVNQGEDPFSSDDEPNPLIDKVEDPFSSDDEDNKPNPLVDQGNDPFSSDDEDDKPNPLVDQGEDPFSDEPNPLVDKGEDPFSSDNEDNKPNPLVDQGNDPFSSDDESDKPNPLVDQGNDPFSSDDEDNKPNPLVDQGNDPFSSDDEDEKPNPLVDQGEDPFSSDDE